ncbi:YdcF family protein [Hyphomicrobium sp.]|uniref:YdcF family protein n=1 Tax=Hyphomicrobium sp. TaxID=82 RepID=UPI002B712F66|nr:YdcF family protein [Hyphomicrobium sp.]HRN89461.1 YdcF family protein [Hyphomicrobium sp.]HRQ26539.1 YdcF family protein [Hyphomicrobium sp.]
MPYTLAKILGLLAQPSSIAVLALSVGIWLLARGRAPRFSRLLAWGGLILIVGGGLSPLANVLILPLEQRFAAVPVHEGGDRVDGIILLGGFEDAHVSAGRGGLGLNEAAERVTEGLRLALRHPDAKVVFTGGAGGLFATAEASGPVGAFLAEAGVDPARLVLESRSRNTYENAVLTKAMVKPRPGQRWYLVTSAYHMPRAMGLFRKAGFDVVAYPVDYRTRGPEDVTRTFARIPQGLMRLDVAVNEWIGLLSYRLLGRTDELFPAP